MSWFCERGHLHAFVRAEKPTFCPFGGRYGENVYLSGGEAEKEEKMECGCLERY
jgi:hypothetical protein